MSQKQQTKPRPDTEAFDQTPAMLEAIIGLLGRSIFPEEKLRGMVVKSKRKELVEQYVKAYNLLDGNHGVTEIAKEIGVKQPTLTTVISTWKGLGIVYDAGKPGKPVYKGLYKLRLKREEMDAEADASDATDEPPRTAEPIPGIDSPEKPAP